MNRKFSFFVVFIVLILSNINVQAATIKGVIYNFDLEPAEKSIIKINTVPEQTFVSKNGSYLFTLKNGEYKINAIYREDSKIFITEENITILNEGEYVLDLILFPDISEEENLLNENLEIPNVNIENNGINYLYILIIFLVILGIIIYFITKKRKLHKKDLNENDIIKDDLNKEVIDFIKEKGGRITQKDIRKRFPVSEAKISLVISELEEKEIIQKFKKGRGNIIILK